MQYLKQMDNSVLLKVAVINRKGGVGKSTITANLAGELALRGLNVGVVDADTQATAALGVCLGLAFDDARDELLYDAMTGRRSIADGARMIPTTTFRVDESLDEIGAIVHVGGGKKTHVISRDVDDADLFGDLLEAFARGWGLQIILVDTGPGMTGFDGSVYDAMDAFLYVTQAETLANLGIQESFEEIRLRNRRRAQRGQRITKILGIQPNMVGRSREQAVNLNQLGEAFGALVWPPIRRLNVFSQMAAHGQIVRVFRPGGPEAEMMRQMADRFEQEVGTWLTAK